MKSVVPFVLKPRCGSSGVCPAVGVWSRMHDQEIVVETRAPPYRQGH
jgi:hypothetical protein